MKKLSMIFVLAIVMVLAVAGIAYAVEGDSTYLGTPGSPHGGYDTNTKKCGVCHAVHHAGEFGDGFGSEALLRSTKADACTYCHIDPGVSTKLVYDQVIANYSGADLNNAHSSAGGATCGGCHQVHAAASAMTTNALLTVKILKEITSVPLTGTAEGTILPTDGYEDALAKWCSGCHAYYELEKNNASHVMTAAAGFGYVASTTCKACHASNTVSGVLDASAFPHYTDGARFLTSAATSNSANVGAVFATDSQYDGVCLRCHRNGAGAGIGLTQ